MENKKQCPIFQKINSELWEKFSVKTLKYYKTNKFNQLETLTPTSKHINHLWDHIKTLILKVAKSHLLHRWVSQNESNVKPRKIVDHYSQLKKLNVILLKFKTKRIHSSSWPQGVEWSYDITTIK